MINSVPSLETLIERALDRLLTRINTSRVGIIQSFDPATGEADVQPADMAPFRNEQGVRVPYQRSVIPHVPVYFPGGGGARDTWPVAAGDACILLHTSNPIARWLVSGGVVDEQNDRKRHAAGNAIALVGLTDFGHWKPAHATARVVGEGAPQTLLGGQDAADPVIRKSDLDQVVATLNDLITKYNRHTNLTNGTLPPALADRGTTLTAPGGSAVVKAK